MRIFSVLFLLMSSITFGQPLTLKIESITFKDSLQNEREFKLKYYITNNTNDTLRFFLDKKSITPSTGGSMSQCPYYKIYENDTFIELGQIFKAKGTLMTLFNDNNANSIKSEEDYHNKYMIYLSDFYKINRDSLESIYKKKGVDGLLYFEGMKYIEMAKNRKTEYQTLLPNEQLECTSVFYWDKNRYFYKEPNEYYLDENAKHYFEITLVCLKEEFKGHIKPEDYDKIIKLPNFIKGVFVSNKVEINLQN